VGLGLPNLKKLFGGIGRHDIRDILSAIRRWHPKIDRSDAIAYACLSLILVVAAVIRLQPVQYGAYLSEFDSFYHYYSTKYVVDNGYQAWFSWHYNNMWYPEGRTPATSDFPGLYFTTATLYFILRFLGVNVELMQLAMFFPILMGVLTCLAMYFLGKDLGGREVGLFSSLALAVSSAYIGRTTFGFFKHETVGIFSLVMLILFFLRAQDQHHSTGRTVGYSLLAGVFLGYLFSSWGASRYPMDLLALYAVVMVLVGKYSRRLLLTYSVTLGSGILIMTQVPKLGFGMLSEVSVLAVLGAFVLMCFAEVMKNMRSKRMQQASLLSFAVLGVLTLLVLSDFGVVSPILGKYAAVLNPIARAGEPIIESVAEHKPSTWASLFFEFNYQLFLAPLGMVFLTQKQTCRGVFMTVFGLTSLYFAASMVRLTLIMAPAFTALAAVGLVTVLKPFVDISLARRITAKRKALTPSKVGRELGIAIIIILFLVTLLPAVHVGDISSVVETSRSPVTLAASTMPVSTPQPDWLEALEYIRDNTEPNAVIVSWWDYGYWISIVGNRTTIVDNATTNTTQIQQVGRLFLSPQNVSLEILKQYNASHIVVFVSTFPSSQSGIYYFIGYGEERKFYWMSEIAGLQTSRFYNQTADARGEDPLLPAFWSETLLGKLIPFQPLPPEYTGNKPFYQYSLKTVNDPHFTLEFSSSNLRVFVYRIKY
jgi:dolichyl-diphosphooligosaccharide--protein glycosyltransferase